MGVALPDVLWDGRRCIPPAAARAAARQHRMRDNRSTRGGIGTFLSLGVPVAGAPLSEADPAPPFPAAGAARAGAGADFELKRACAGF